MTDKPVLAAPFAVDFICCGLDDGSVVRQTWKEADDLRWSYMDAPNHKRAAIIRQPRPDDPRHSTFVRVGYDPD